MADDPRSAAKEPDRRSTEPAKGSVAVAIGVLIDDQPGDRRVLIAQRPKDSVLGGCWEFPGGKVEPGETVAQAIRRELAEELGVEVAIGEPVITLNDVYGHGAVRLHVRACRMMTGEPAPLASQRVAWVPVSALRSYRFPEANGPILERLIELFGGA